MTQSDKELADEIERILAEYHRSVELDDASLLPKIMSKWCDLFFKPGASAILTALRRQPEPVVHDFGEFEGRPLLGIIAPDERQSSDKVLVPREPTWEMIRAGDKAQRDAIKDNWQIQMDKAYRAMLAAAEGHHE